MKNPFTLLIIGIVVLLGALWGYNAWHNSATSGPQNLSSSGYTKGGENATVTLTEFGDFQCPACAAYSPVVNQLSNLYGNDLKIVYKYFPLQMHKNGVTSAQAAEAAGMQGKFWEMHDILFDKQKDWEELDTPKAKFAEYAASIGLDMTKWNSDYDSEQVLTKVKGSLQEALDIKASYTPYFLINGVRIDNPQTPADFVTLINTKLPANLQKDAAGLSNTAAPAATSTQAQGPAMTPQTTTGVTGSTGADYAPNGTPGTTQRGVH